MFLENTIIYTSLYISVLSLRLLLSLESYLFKAWGRQGLYVFVYVVILLSLSFTFAQETYQCEEINQGDFFSARRSPPSVCAEVIDYTVGIPSYTCQSEIEAALSSIPTFNALLSEACGIALNRALCTLSYPKCNTISNSFPSTTVFAAPCASLCTDVYAKCTSIEIGILGQLGLTTKLQCDKLPWMINETLCNSGPKKPTTFAAIQRPQCASYNGKVCSGNLPGKVYIPPGYTLEVLEKLMTSQQFTYAISSTSNSCNVMQQAWTCANTLMECQEGEVNIPMGTQVVTLKVPLPRLPCKSFCELYVSSCQSFFSLDKELRAAFEPDCEKETFRENRKCDGTVTSPGSENYPSEKTVFLSHPQLGDLTSYCSLSSSVTTPLKIASSVTTVHSICPYPLVVPDETVPGYVPRIVDGACSLGCPMHFYTEQDYTWVDSVSVIGICISLICVCFFCISWVVFKEERRSPYYMYINACLIFFYLFLLIGAIRARAIGAPNIASSYCKNNAQEYQFEGFCLVQGTIFAYSVLAAVSWWVIQAADIFRSLVLDIKIVEGSLSDIRLKIAYHLFAWVPPAISVGYLLAKEQIGAYQGGSPWCLISVGRFADQPDLSLPAMFTPMFVYTCVGVFLMAVVMIRIFVLSRVMENRNKSIWERYMCGTYLRIVAYFFSVMVLWVYLFVYKTYAHSRREIWAQSARQMVTCLLFQQPLTGDSCDGFERMPIGMFAFMIFLASFSGLFTFLAHSTTFRVYRLWAGLLYNNLRKIHPRLAISCCRQFYAGAHTTTNQLDTNNSNFSQMQAMTEDGQGTGSRPTGNRAKAGLFKSSTGVRSVGNFSGNTFSGGTTTGDIHVALEMTRGQTSRKSTSTVFPPSNEVEDEQNMHQVKDRPSVSVDEEITKKYGKNSKNGTNEIKGPRRKGFLVIDTAPPPQPDTPPPQPSNPSRSITPPPSPPPLPPPVRVTIEEESVVDRTRKHTISTKDTPNLAGSRAAGSSRFAGWEVDSRPPPPPPAPFSPVSIYVPDMETFSVDFRVAQDYEDEEEIDDDVVIFPRFNPELDPGNHNRGRSSKKNIVATSSTNSRNSRGDFKPQSSAMANTISESEQDEQPDRQRRHFKQTEDELIAPRFE